VLSQALARALAVTEVNARMGRIVAAPTAGSCGILPAVLLTLAQKDDLADEKLLPVLFTAAGFGLVIANKASISGASGGCQAECGSAAAMAAAAATELLGGTPEQAAQACALALKSVLGLVCDPVAGLVEVPCIKRNASGTANAFVATEMALAGISSVIPADEVIGAMKAIGDQMAAELKETALGGLAATKTARKIAADLL
jgi:L-serine dehydratase